MIEMTDEELAKVLAAAFTSATKDWNGTWVDVARRAKDLLLSKPAPKKVKVKVGQAWRYKEDTYSHTFTVSRIDMKDGIAFDESGQAQLSVHADGYPVWPSVWTLVREAPPWPQVTMGSIWRATGAADDELYEVEFCNGRDAWFTNDRGSMWVNPDGTPCVKDRWTLVYSPEEEEA